MKTNENQKSTNHQPAAQKPFFGTTPDHAFFSAERAASPPFFQPKAISPSAIQAKSATSEAEGITQPLVQQNQPTIQAKPSFRGLSHSLAAESQAVQLRDEENQTGLPDDLKAGIENLSGYSLDNVKVHYNSPKPAQLQALAYTQGAEIHVAAGQEQHLPHEAWHVVQQMQGRVKPTMQMEEELINDDQGLEREAYVMGGKALQMRLTRMSDEDDSRETQHNLAPTTSKINVKQMVSFLNVKRIANNGSMYMGKDTAGLPSLAHGGGTNWYGTKATAAEYGKPPGAIWHMKATRSLNLIDMSTADSIKWIMEETTRRRGINGLSPSLLDVLGNFDFAYAIPNAVAAQADAYLKYAVEGVPWPGDAYGVNQGQMDEAIGLAGSAQDFPLMAGSVIQTFAGHTSVNAVHLNDVNFLANPDTYRIVRKDATNLDAGFANALLDNLNDPNLFHGLYVPLGMKFGGWTGTKLEVLIKGSPTNLAIQGQVAANGLEQDLQVTDKMIGVDNSLLAWAWWLFGMNK
jgi:hypothetical protein